jgi:DNA-binding NarL/FixJ family response regulator
MQQRSQGSKADTIRLWLVALDRTSGARGFLAKGAPSTALADVVHRVYEGHRYVDPILAADAFTAAPSPLTRPAPDLAAARRSAVAAGRRLGR